MEIKCAVSPFTSKARKTIDKYCVLKTLYKLERSEVRGNNVQGYCRVKCNKKKRNLGSEGGGWGQLRLLSTVKVDLKKTAYFNFIN